MVPRSFLGLGAGGEQEKIVSLLFLGEDRAKILLLVCVPLSQVPAVVGTAEERAASTTIRLRTLVAKRSRASLHLTS